MNFFLAEPWLETMKHIGSVAQGRRLELPKGAVWLGEYRGYGQRKWLLYGAFDPPQTQDLDPLFAQARKEGVFQVESHFNMARWNDESLLRSKNASITEHFGTFLLDLRLTSDLLWSGMHGKHRNMVRRAQTEGLEVRLDFDLEEFSPLMDQSYAKGGGENPFSRVYLQRLMGMNQVLRVGVYSPRGLEAAAMVPFDESRGYFLHGATRSDNQVGAANLLHWHIMETLKQMDVPHYDLGGARRETTNPRLEGIFRFKERFGGVFEPCFYWLRVTRSGRKSFHDLCARFSQLGR